MIAAPRKQLFEEMTEARRPRKLQLELTRSCNLRCRHCRVDHPDPDVRLPLELVRRLIPEIRRLGTFVVNLTGGEITTHPEFHGILEMLLEWDFQLVLQTNATLIDDITRRLLRAGRLKVDAISVSLYGARAETHEAITRAPGSFEKTMSNMEALRDDGHYVIAACLQMADNIEDFDEVRELCAAKGFSFRYGALVTPGNTGGRRPLDCRMDASRFCRMPAPTGGDGPPRPQAIRPPDARQPLSDWCPMGCGLGFISATGDVLPCLLVHRAAGNVREAPLDAIWEQSDALISLRHLRIGDFECGSCELFSKCRPCPGVALLEHGDLFRRPREMCRIAQAFFNKGDEAG